MDKLLSFLLVCGLCYTGYLFASTSGRIEHSTITLLTTDDVEDTEESSEEEDEDKTIYQNEEHENAEIYEGSLILVNNTTKFQQESFEYVSVYEVKLEAGSHSFSVRDSEVVVRSEVADSLIAMFEDFYSATYDDNIVVLSGYRSAEKQQELYDADLSETGLDYSDTVAMAGYSEHQTGYAVDLSLYDGSDYDGTGIYSWIETHCYEYGFILRYMDGKTDLTEISYEPWHYRYVGKPHAYYIMTKNLCLEEYLELLKNYPYEEDHLLFTDNEGIAYEVYYVVVDTEYDTTMVPVPSEYDYSISGNNTDGFIVTVTLGANEIQEDSATDEDASEEQETLTQEEE